MANLRSDLIALIEPLLPTSWLWIPYPTNLDTVTQTTVVLNLGTVKSSGISSSQWVVEYVLIVVDPGTQIDEAFDSLDSSLMSLLTALDNLQNIQVGTASSSVTDTKPGNLCYNIPLTVYTNK